MKTGELQSPIEFEELSDADLATVVGGAVPGVVKKPLIDTGKTVQGVRDEVQSGAMDLVDSLENNY